MPGYSTASRFPKPEYRSDDQLAHGNWQLATVFTMATEFNERVWLTWLVKMRVLIITILFVLEMAIVKLSLVPTPVPVNLFIAVIFSWYTVAAIFYATVVRFGERRLGMLARIQVLAD